MAGEDLAPNYILEVEGHELRSDVTQFISKVEYESADGIIDVAKVTAMNPDHILSSSKVFAPGNEMNIYMGYGPAHVRLVGRVVLMKPEISFPQGGIPLLEITGYTRDYLMRETRPDPEIKARESQLKERISAIKGKGSQKRKKHLRNLLKRLKQAVVYTDASVREIVEDRAMGHGFSLDVDDAPWPKGTLTQPARLSDFDLIQGLANQTGFLFWVDYDFERGWTLHFRDPDGDLSVQDTEYTFRWNQGDKSTLNFFEPKMIFQDHFTELRVRGRLHLPSGKIQEVEVPVVEPSETEADPHYAQAIEELEIDFESAEAVKLFIGDYSFAIKPKTEFRSRAAMEVWASQWFRRTREQFIVGNGSVMGLESLRARQIHSLEGMGIPYDGRYYFSKVRHISDRDSGYHCEISARKVLQ